MDVPLDTYPAKVPFIHKDSGYRKFGMFKGNSVQTNCPM